MNDRLIILEARCDRLKRMLKDSGVLTTKLVLDLYSEGKLTMNDVRYLLDVPEEEDAEVEKDGSKNRCVECRFCDITTTGAKCYQLGWPYSVNDYSEACSRFKSKEEQKTCGDCKWLRSNQSVTYCASRYGSKDFYVKPNYVSCSGFEEEREESNV